MKISYCGETYPLFACCRSINNEQKKKMLQLYKVKIQYLALVTNNEFRKNYDLWGNSNVCNKKKWRTNNRYHLFLP